MKSSTYAYRSQLLSRARGGDQEALEALVAVYRQYLRLLAKIRTDRLLRKKLDSSDLVQETCMRLFEEFPKFRGESIMEFEAFLRAMLAKRKAKIVRRYYGVKGRDVRLEQELAAGLEASAQALALDPTDPGSQPVDQLMRKEAALELADALYELPESQREVVVLHRLEGLSLREIGDQIDKSENAVQKLWARGLLRLGEILRKGS